MRIATILSLFFLVSCGSQTQVPIRDVRTDAPESGPPDYYFLQSYPGITEFEQGIGRSLELISHVRVPGGVPVLTINNLPAGATFDGTTISWTPPCGDFPDFYQRGVGVQHMVATLKSSGDPDQFVQQKMAFIVHKFKEFPDRKCGEAQ